MMIISFAWTTEAFLQGLKTETRRFWDDEYMRRFVKVCAENDGCFLAYDKSPRFGGKRIGICRLKSKPFKQQLKFVTESDEKAEGGLWGSAAKYVEMMGGPYKEPYVIKFEVLAKAPDNVSETANLFNHE